MYSIESISLADIMSSALQVIAPDSTVVAAARLMDRARVSCLVVTQGGELIGILTEADIPAILLRGDAAELQVRSVMHAPVITAPAETEFRTAYALLRRHHIRHLVVTGRAGELAGVVTATDFRAHLSRDVLARIDHLQAVLDPVVAELPPEATLALALERMVESQWEYVLVTAGGKPLGILTERDIPRLLAAAVDPEKLRLAEVMHLPLHCLLPEVSVAEASATMARLRVRRLPVVDGAGHLLGVVSQTRLLDRLGLALFDDVWQDRLNLQEHNADLESRLQLVVDAADLGVWDYDHRQDRIRWNVNLAALLGHAPGWSPQDWDGWVEIIHADDRETVLARADAAMKRPGVLFEAEYRMRHRCGDWVWIHTRGRVLQRDQQGLPLSSAGTATDVSERKNAELLLEAQRRFTEAMAWGLDRNGLVAAAFEIAVGLPETDGGALYTRETGGYYRMSAARGLSAEFTERCAVVPRDALLAHWIGDGSIRCSCAVPDVLCAIRGSQLGACGEDLLIGELDREGQGMRSAVVVPVHIDGEFQAGILVICRHSARASRNTMVGLETLANQLSQALLKLRAQRETERQNELVRREKQFSEDVINALPGGFYMLDDSGRMQRWNRLVADLSGYTDVELAQRHGTDFFRGDDRQRIAAAIAEAFGQGQAALAAEFVTRDDRAIPHYFTARRCELGGQPYVLGVAIDISREQGARQALEAERLRLQSLLRAIPDLVWLKGPDGGYLFCNPQFERFFGKPETAIVGKTDFDFVSTDLAGLFGEKDRAAVAAGGSLMSEEWLSFAADGYHGLFETIRTPLFDGGGRLVGVLGIARDITERRQAQKALQESLGDYRELVAQIPVGIYKFRHRRDDRIGFDYVSPRWCEMLELDEAQVMADAGLAFDRVHPDDRADFAQANERSRRDLSPFHWEGRILLPSARVRWLHLESQPVLQKNGDVLWSGIQFDITDRHNVETTQRLAAGVFRNTQEGIVISDRENAILDVNPAFTRITGYSREEVLGRNPKLLSSGLQGADFYAEMWHALAEKGSWRGEIQNRRKSGEVYAEMLSIAAVRDDRGTIQQYVGVFSDISRLKEHEAELDRIAHYDTLTGVPNRRLLADRMNQAVARARRSGRILAVCYLDLDGFKPVNDRFGHEAGDRLLVMLTRDLQAVLRSDDTLARLGGDEFVLLFNDLDRDQEVCQLLERVLAIVARPVDVGKALVTVSVSIGVTLFPHDDADSDTLLRHADQAMYRAKEAGRNRFHLFDPAHDRQVQAQRETLQRIAEALRRQEFVLYFQPTVQLVSGEVAGLEALIRWQHPQLGLLSPGEFLPILSGTGLERALGEWVIDRALAQMAEWHASGLNVPLSVNVSTGHLLDGNFIERLRAALSRYPQISAGDLELEVVETVALGELERAAKVLDAARNLGVRFALDDFGTGYSSLACLRQLPAETLKIDRSFVQDLLDDPDDFGIVEGVVRLAEAFNRKVVAEGVETQQHAAMLVKLGCKLGQGFAIGRPMPAESMPGWVATWRKESPGWLPPARMLRREDVALLVASVSHRQWTERVSACVLDPATFSPPELDDHSCRFGQWYYGRGQETYGGLTEFKGLEPLHRQIHALAAELVGLARQGRLDYAQSRLGELIALRERLSHAYEELIERVVEGG
ncbi:MAG: EAL domain-containing protein [Methylococcaceae bacterium]|nr:EAL domain-containing protein [Methylococcaceae bacterium]